MKIDRAYFRRSAVVVGIRSDIVHDAIISLENEGDNETFCGIRQYATQGFTESRQVTTCKRCLKADIEFARHEE